MEIREGIIPQSTKDPNISRLDGCWLFEPEYNPHIRSPHSYAPSDLVRRTKRCISTNAAGCVNGFHAGYSTNDNVTSIDRGKLIDDYSSSISATLKCQPTASETG
jgi:hypothetical protein